ncbi:hypothetical protein BRARA_I02515 [Brassica rapa]|uniref:Uncharacterized protein n=2 Tax=Brassica TaxID=3705 RepID=A0A397XZ41_BRACM|nr:hypothetical protein BRARA_I02515 [Brassica rapa]CAF2043274.1 unnamed protein product [Brassica napus]CAG7862752.1 unnamed protein product [Brassica rapa]
MSGSVANSAQLAAPLTISALVNPPGRARKDKTTGNLLWCFHCKLRSSLRFCDLTSCHISQLNIDLAITTAKLYSATVVSAGLLAERFQNFL